MNKEIEEVNFDFDSYNDLNSKRALIQTLETENANLREYREETEARIFELEERNKALQAECERLQAENAMLRDLIEVIVLENSRYE